MRIELFCPGLPDFYWYGVPKPESCTKDTQNVPNGIKNVRKTF
jgi:hypothetical protein